MGLFDFLFNSLKNISNPSYRNEFKSPVYYAEKYASLSRRNLQNDLREILKLVKNLPQAKTETRNFITEYSSKIILKEVSIDKQLLRPNDYTELDLKEYGDTKIWLKMINKMNKEVSKYKNVEDEELKRALEYILIKYCNEWIKLMSKHLFNINKKLQAESYIRYEVKANDNILSIGPISKSSRTRLVGDINTDTNIEDNTEQEENIDKKNKKNKNKKNKKNKKNVSLDPFFDEGDNKKGFKPKNNNQQDQFDSENNNIKQNNFIDNKDIRDDNVEQRQNNQQKQFESQNNRNDNIMNPNDSDNDITENDYKNENSDMNTERMGLDRRTYDYNDDETYTQQYGYGMKKKNSSRNMKTQKKRNRRKRPILSLKNGKNKKDNKTRNDKKNKIKRKSNIKKTKKHK
jgi:hypothetical protein